MIGMRMKVKDCYHKVRGGVEVLKREASIDVVIDAICHEPTSRALYVVDDQERLVGIISMIEVFRLLGSQYLPREVLPHATSTMAQKAEDLMVPPVMVYLDDEIKAALRVAVIHQMEDLPVVDREGKVVGNLDCFEILKGIKDLCPIKPEADEAKA